MNNLGCECSGTNKKRVGPDQDGRFYFVDCDCKTATQTQTEPRSCREYIMRAERDDAIVSRARQTQRVNSWTWEQTLEYMVVAMIDNRKDLTRMLSDAYACRPVDNRIVSGE